jgi:hypothetical protein
LKDASRAALGLVLREEVQNSSGFARWMTVGSNEKGLQKIAASP